MGINIFDFPTKIIFGLGTLTELGKEARALGKKALIATCPEIQNSGLLDTALKDLSFHGVGTVIFSGVEPNPRSSTVDRGAEIARLEQVDLVIGLGGGSAMDAAKGIALASSQDEPIWKYTESKITLIRPVPPIIQVPTLAGTGAEVSRGAVITNWPTHIKKSLISPHIQARVAIVDPELTLTAPDSAARAGAVDAFSHAVEPYITAEREAPLTDGIRETIMKMVLDYLPRMILNPKDEEPRVQLSWASTMAMSQIARLGGGGGFMPCHGLGHALSGYYDISHGNSLSALLPVWMRLTYPATQERFRRMNTNIFGGGDSIGRFEEWLENVGMKLRLRDLGFELNRAEEIAALAVRSSAGLRHNPVPIDQKIAAQIYLDVY
jgi:alcohol dehydrogenase class IV